MTRWLPGVLGRLPQRTVMRDQLRRVADLAGLVLLGDGEHADRAALAGVAFLAALASVALRADGALQAGCTALAGRALFAA